MHPVLESLWHVVETDPLPEAYTSSYWKEFGSQIVVARRGESLDLRGAQIGAVYVRNPALRTLEWVGRASHRRFTRSLPHYPRVWRAVKRLAGDLSFGLTYDVWKPGVILSILLQHWEQQRLAPRTFAVIGDGYGFLSALIYRYLPGVRIYCVDLPKTLMFQATTHQRAHPQASLSLLSAQTADRSADVTLVIPQEVERVGEAIDCAINIASMQEMNAFTIAAYFTFLRRRSRTQSRFYCVNRLEKRLPGGEVARFHDYPWQADDQLFLDAACPFYHHFVSAKTLPQGPRVAGLRVPFVNHFDGVHWHRLARLSPR